MKEVKDPDTFKSYIAYVKEVLEGLNRSECKASYDTGYGLHIVGEYLGDEPMGFFVVQSSIGKIRPPRMADFESWEKAWDEGKRLVREFTGETR